jgi:hypothetical protein
MIDDDLAPGLSVFLLFLTNFSGCDTGARRAHGRISGRA